MKPIKITLIVLSVIFPSALKAQTTPSKSLSELKMEILHFLFINNENITVNYWYRFNDEKEYSILKQKDKPVIEDSVLFTDEAIVFPTDKGNVYMNYYLTPIVHYQEINESSKFYHGWYETAIIHLGNWNITVFVHFEKPKNKKTEQDFSNQVINHAKLYVTEFIQNWSLIGNIRDSLDYEKFKHNYIILTNSTKTSAITEVQRKLIVQANFFNENKNYDTALEYYNQAIQANEFSYPAAYYNMALIAAELKYYSYAILNMKKYLLLMPDAEDARKAQDKIYEWEAELNLYISKYLKQ